MTTELVVQAEGVHKAYRGRSALSGLDLEVPRGRVYCLLGPNGAGKSTLIRVLCGLLRPDAGIIEVLGWRVPSIRIQSQIGYMPQEIALYDDLTISQNLRFFGELYELPRDQIRRRSDELLSLVELSDRRGERVGALSGGMKRRASLAVSLLHKPRLLFLDEPTAGVDPQLRRSFWKHFIALTEEDVTVFLTTHLMDEAANSQVIGFLSHGRLLAQGHLDELLQMAGASDLESAFIALEGKD
jgi:ABC-2 type transport system ATP-binding protein